MCPSQTSMQTTVYFAIFIFSIFCKAVLPSKKLKQGIPTVYWGKCVWYHYPKLLMRKSYQTLRTIINSFLQSCHNLRDTCIIKTKSRNDFVPFQQIATVLIFVSIEIVQEILEYIIIHMTILSPFKFPVVLSNESVCHYPKKNQFGVIHLGVGSTASCYVY